MDERNQPQVLLRVEEAAAYLAIGRSKTYTLIAEGRLPSVRIGGSVRVPRASLEEWVARSTRVPVEAA